MRKDGFQFGFGWMFAIFVGAILIFLAIYLSSQLVGLRRLEAETVAGRDIGIILSPIETSLEEAKAVPIIVRQETRIFNSCSRPTQFNPFGSQLISTSIKSGLGDEWNAQPGIASSFHNKYLFSDYQEEANRNFFTLSKPFYFPYKVADFIILWSDKEEFCFINAPSDILSDIENLDLKNIIPAGSLTDSSCSENSKKVCFNFDDSRCDIIANTGSGSKYVKKNARTLYYFDSMDRQNSNAMLYAAIFSNYTHYNCQVDRVMERAGYLADLYLEKSILLTARGCSSQNIQAPLGTLSRELPNINESRDLSNFIFSQANNVKEKNDPLTCNLF